MKTLINRFSSVITPAFVYDENTILKLINRVNNIEDCKVLFTLKSFAIASALDFMAPMIAGFSVSSLFEAKLARNALPEHKSVHLTSPGLRFDEIGSFSELCDYVSFNSLSQMKRFRDSLGANVRQGLRINPQISFVKDKRYDPCRQHSKLGVPLEVLKSVLCNEKNLLKRENGIHFHSNCESADFGQLAETIQYIKTHIPELLKRISWINLGGGYLFEESNSIEMLSNLVQQLKQDYELEVFFEPGKGIVGDSGFIVSSVLDFSSNGDQIIAVLDTTVNHMPEVFEYQYKPSIIGESRKGRYKYILAGASCLAGDLFGKYGFNEPLEIGSKIVFKSMGAYTMVKANMFNGINLPSIYAFTAAGKLELKKQFTYEDYSSRCGVE